MEVSVSDVIEASRLEVRIMEYSVVRTARAEVRDRIRSRIRRRPLAAIRRIDRALERRSAA